MSTTFSEFLRQHAEKHREEQKAAQAIIREWHVAIEALFTQIREWLKVSDPQGVIKIKQSETEVTEPNLGQYEVPRLDLRVFGKWIGIIPKARKTVGTAHPPQKTAPQRAAGRVDITDELRRYVLYRFQGDTGDAWVIVDSNLEEKPLDQDAFERALMSYLS